MAKALFIFFMSEALVAPDAKTVETGGHILGVRNVIVNEHVSQWLARDVRTISDFKLAIVLQRHLHLLFPSCGLGIALSLGFFV
jgi:hypothetical protein